MPLAAELVADKGYDSKALRDWLAERRTTAVIPPRKNRKVQYHYDKTVYRQRNIIERMFCRLKDWRRIATRFDRREADLREGLDAAGVPLAALEFRGMGFRDGAADVRDFRRACADRRVVPAPSLLLRSAMAEARTVADRAANHKLSKGSQGGRRVRARDDAAAAAILAVADGARIPAAPRRRWRYVGMAG